MRPPGGRVGIDTGADRARPNGGVFELWIGKHAIKNEVMLATEKINPHAFSSGTMSAFCVCGAMLLYDLVATV